MKHLFFVEDDLSLINGLSFALNKEGYTVDVARTKQEAEALWLKEKFDLVILDPQKNFIKIKTIYNFLPF